LALLGEKIQLKDWDGFAAGLDVETNRTGHYSIYTTWRNNEIMFHVSTMLPFTEGDHQQLSRKRHLGNDIVVIVFYEGKHPFVFDPLGIKSFFNHVFFVITRDKKASKEKGETVYRISVVYKNGVHEFQPPIPNDGLLEKNDLGRDFLLTKLINSERAAYSAPGFAKAITRTREVLLNDLGSSFTKESTAHGSGWM